VNYSRQLSDSLQLDVDTTRTTSPKISKTALLTVSSYILSHPVHNFTMSSSPTPEERDKKDKEDRAREKEEQAKLPYKWTQTIEDLDVTVAVPGNLRGKDIVVDLKKTYLKIGVKGQEPVIDVRTAYMLHPYILYATRLSR